MKKIYVKPEAKTVAFAVNENIATSGFYTESNDGIVSYKQDEAGCNDILNGTHIETGLPDNNYDINVVMKNLEARIEENKDENGNIVMTSALMELWKILNQLKDDKLSFVCS